MRTILAAMIIAILSGCSSAHVDITKTGKGFYEPTRAANVEILKTVPEKNYVELGTVTITGFGTTDAAKMHNAIRAEAAPLGADAVIITDEGVIVDGWGGQERWGTGVAIKYQ